MTDTCSDVMCCYIGLDGDFGLIGEYTIGLCRGLFRQLHCYGLSIMISKLHNNGLEQMECVAEIASFEPIRSNVPLPSDAIRNTLVPCFFEETMSNVV